MTMTNNGDTFLQSDPAPPETDILSHVDLR